MKLTTVILTVILVTLNKGGVTLAHLFPCPAEYGKCNNCTKIMYGEDHTVVALSREICPPYSEKECKKIFQGNGGLCTDGCSDCKCLPGAMAKTLKKCEKYVKQNCLNTHPDREWTCDGLTCVCTSSAIGTYNPKSVS